MGVQPVGARLANRPWAVDDLFSNPAYQPLDVTAEQVFAADALTFTRDPFDALICASAQTMAVPLITRDAQIRAWGAVKVIW